MLEEGLKKSRREEESYTYVCDQCGYNVKVDSIFVIHESGERVQVTTEVECDDCGNIMESDD